MSEWSFVSQHTGDTQRGGLGGAQELVLPPPPTVFPRTSQSYHVTLLVRSYVPGAGISWLTETCEDKCPRICASWVEALPVLCSQVDLGRASVLKSAVETLVFTIADAHELRQSGSISGICYIQSYYRAIRLLRKTLSSGNRSSHMELLVAIMCLNLCEVSHRPCPVDSKASHLNRVLF